MLSGVFGEGAIKMMSAWMNMRDFGKEISKGISDGIKAVERESVANNFLKMHGRPMKRKTGKKDKRGALRRSVVKMNRLIGDHEERLKKARKKLADVPGLFRLEG